MKINCTTIKNGKAYGWTMPEKPTFCFLFNQRGESYVFVCEHLVTVIGKFCACKINNEKYNEAVNKARAEAIEWEDQVDAVDLLLPADARYDFGEHFDEPIDGDYSHEPIDVDKIRVTSVPTECDTAGKCLETESFKGGEHEGVYMCDDGCIWAKYKWVLIIKPTEK